MDTRLHILVVDDDFQMTHTLSDILTMVGHHVELASSGKDALRKVKAGYFDCVVADIRMPGMNGVELHRELRKVKPELPVVLMTAYTSEELIQQGLEEGVIATIDKPLDVAKLLDFFSSLANLRGIAIIDEDPIFYETLADILKRRGFRVVKVDTPHARINEIAEDTHLVVMNKDQYRIHRMTMLPDKLDDSQDVSTILTTPLAIPDLLATLAGIRTELLRKNFHSDRDVTSRPKRFFLVYEKTPLHKRIGR